MDNYETRVTEFEAQGMTRSDAQSAVEAEDIATNAALDPRDRAILKGRQAARRMLTGPHTGDVFQMLDGTTRRFTHNWGEAGLQISQIKSIGQFYLAPGGWLKYSGGLAQCVPLECIAASDAVAMVPAWFFHHDRAAAGNGVQCLVEVRVWRETIPHEMAN